MVARVRPPIIWYVPHPDDETIFMGGSIAMHRGRRNIVVALTRGGASAAIKRVNKRLKKPIDREAFMRGRMRELRAGVAALGIRPDSVVSIDLPDGGLQVEAVRSVIEDFARRYPRAAHRTLSYLDPHDDHRTAGEALRAAYRAGVVRDCRFHLPVPLVDAALGEPVRLSRRAVAAKRAAIAEYEVWRPRKGRYAIGAQSVAKLIRFQRETPTERVHGPDYQP
jgi:LmbE family N-acetylglucosaminyl deacetylase